MQLVTELRRQVEAAILSQMDRYGAASNDKWRQLLASVDDIFAAVPYEPDAPITTYSGIKFSPLAPRLEDITIEDIAHHLAGLNRWLGATVRPYSIAQHSIHVAECVPPADRLWALLHDASEAYLNDLPRNVKHAAALAPYRAIEAVLQRVIYHRFGLTGEAPASVKIADQALAVSEAQDLLIAVPVHFPEAIKNRTAPRAPFPLAPWSAADAERRFLEMFHTLSSRA